LLSRICAALAGDVAAAESARVMRLPGSHNSKDGEWLDVVVLDQLSSWKRYSYAALDKFFSEAEATPLLTYKKQSNVVPIRPSNPFTDLYYELKGLTRGGVKADDALAAMEMHSVRGNGIDDVMTKVVGKMVRESATIEAVIDTLLEPVRLVFERDRKPSDGAWNEKRIRREIKQKYRYFQTKDANKPAAPASEKRKLGDRKFILTALDDITISPEPVYLIDELITAGPTLGVIGGPPKKGKSFGAIDACMHIAMGRDFMGLKVQQGTVVYITSEGVRGFRRRMVAVRKHYNVEGKSVPFYVVNVMPNLGSKDTDARLLIEDINAALPEGVKPAIVVIDTLSRAIPGKSDKEGLDMSEFIENCDIISRELQCTTCVVHHSPRADDGRLRGANQLDGALDFLIMVTKDERSGICTASVTSAKDFEEHMTWQYRIESVEIQEPDLSGANGFRTVRVGVANGLKPAARELASERENKAKAVRLTTKQTVFFDILNRLIFDEGKMLKKSADTPANMMAVTRDELKTTLKNKGFYDPALKEDAVRARTSDHLNALAAKKLIGANATHVWAYPNE